jgi:hypothetical protein
VTVTIDDLAELLGFPATPADPEQLDRALSTARAIITPYLIADLIPTADQTAALDFATLTVAKDLWRLKDSAGGNFLWGDGSDSGGILPRDQLNSVWPTLCSAGLVQPTVIA